MRVLDLGVIVCFSLYDDDDLWLALEGKVQSFLVGMVQN